ncbi:DUF6468 domain-containing protein [Paremcibacter congregatus]|uniref:DUF6468 domain-containing protein n=1 Tax=Paremcibacter congregatus TaxID=2043170 RepID=A0A2G4YLZ0_9PROT|nr:DUF6468 domain-containing protein [Paremcibacter congregatus]PHZ83345.1 hypothetical protein CRD36_17415 [Paremcibacter congregatus]QDE28183.1 hypothetical protein FIV45_13380 [Paremcibacter congregatus]
MALFIDILIIVLIGVMITYAIILNSKLKTFRNAQNEMATLVGQLNDAISRAQTSVEALKGTALAEEGRLDALIRKSRPLADELTILTESGENLADRIERGLVPPGGRLNEASDDDDQEDDTVSEADVPEAENEMLAALKKVR